MYNYCTSRIVKILYKNKKTNVKQKKKKKKKSFGKKKKKQFEREKNTYL